MDEGGTVAVVMRWTAAMSATVAQGGMVVVLEVKSQGWMEVRGALVLSFLQLLKGE